ncbi:MAG: hypothetical protein OXE97_03205, partial [Gammaproteobacteria bacterium]|nr:hypothetical protein [Gammaproteobacteria bacterium]MCY4281517.1 hypothetical protein [Gammaproteobacteria bacterium]
MLLVGRPTTSISSKDEIFRLGLNQFSHSFVLLQWTCYTCLPSKVDGGLSIREVGVSDKHRYRHQSGSTGGIPFAPSL